MAKLGNSDSYAMWVANIVRRPCTKDPRRGPNLENYPCRFGTGAVGKLPPGFWVEGSGCSTSGKISYHKCPV